MAWGVDQTTIGNSGSSSTTSFTSSAAVASGAWVIIYCGVFGATDITGVTDNASGLTYTELGEAANGSVRVAIYGAYAPSGIASGTIYTFTHSGGSPGNQHIAGASFTGGSSGSVAEATASNTGSTSAHSVSVTSVTDNALILQATHVNTTGGNTPDANSTEHVDFSAGGLAQQGILQRRTTVTTAGSYTVGGSAGATTWASIGVSLSLTAPPIYLVAQSATPTGTATGTAAASPLNMTYPGGIAADDMIVVVCGLKPDTATFSTPSGYNALTNSTTSGGGGTTGADTGPTKAAVFTRTADGSESGTLAVTLGSTPNSAWGKILVFRKADAGATWDVAHANGIDSTTGTPFTAAMGTDPGFDVDDMAVVMGVIPTDVTTPAQFSSPTLTGTGLTVTITENSEPETTQNNDLGGVICLGLVSGGPSGGAPTFSTTAGGTTTNVRGPIVTTRLRAEAVAAAASLIWQPAPSSLYSR